MKISLNIPILSFLLKICYCSIRGGANVKKILKFSLVTILLLSFLVVPQNTGAETYFYEESSAQSYDSVESGESIVEPYDSIDNIFKKIR